MKITFLGATHEVTGSCYYLEAAGKKFLVDCGMEQGPNYYENEEIPVPPGDLDFVLLTHAHMDHSGNLPALFAKGFRGPVYATDATCHLCDIMLRDSAHIQMFEAEWRNRKGRRQGKPEFVPAYTMEDAMGVIKNLVKCEYDRQYELMPGIKVRFVDAGHLLGSSSIEIWIEEDGKEEKIVFSGDIGNLDQPLIRDPQYISEADYVVMESTYGDRSHGPRPDYVKYSFTFWEDISRYSTVPKRVTSQVGQSSGPAAAAASVRYHRVVKGDTLWAIAKRYDVKLAELIALNPQIKNPNLIRVGDEVRVQ